MYLGQDSDEGKKRSKNKERRVRERQENPVLTVKTLLEDMLAPPVRPVHGECDQVPPLGVLFIVL